MTHLLSPAGDMECLKAAVYAGADEVYFGLSEFNARKNAKNFSLDEAFEAIKFCRLYGVKTNITLNTLLYKNEYADAVGLVGKLENGIRPDSYIIQDIGLASLLVEKYPDISLHASTQMQLHGSYSVGLMKKLGFDRVVLAREMSREDIKAFSDKGIETEVFIHGAMCVCRSGGCLMSSMIGKRSGNRGECAYPCRMSYNKGYPMSLKDLCLAKYIPELMDMGISALKIEGRMKSPEYVYGVTKIYRRLLDEKRGATDDEIKALSSLFSRSGFTDGYYTKKLGKTMFGVRTDEDKANTREAEEKPTERKIPVSVKFSAKIGENSSLCLSSGKNEVTVNGFAPEAAKERPTSVDDVKKQLSRFGNTPFEVRSVDCDIEDGFYPVSLLNSLRREGAEKLTDLLCSVNAPQRTTHVLPEKLVPEEAEERLTVRFEGESVSDAACERADIIAVPLYKKEVWKKLLPYADKLSLILPGFVFDSRLDAVKEMMAEAKECGVKRLTLPNLSFVPFCDGFILDGGYELNCITSVTAEVLEGLGFDNVCASPEAKNAPWRNSSVVVYGRIRLMHTRNCLIRNSGKCTDRRGGTLNDRTNATFPVFCDFDHSNSIYNSVPVWLLDKNVRTSKTVIFTTENEKEQDGIIKALDSALPPKGKFTRAYFAY